MKPHALASPQPTGEDGSAPSAAPSSAIERPIQVVAPPFAEVFAEHFSRVHRNLRYLGVREADLDDVAQEVFITVHKKLGEFEGRSSLRTWIHGIALLAATNHRRLVRTTREQPLDGTERLVVAPESGTEARNALLALLGALDDQRRTVVVLHDIEGLSIPDVAKLLSIPTPTAYSQLRSARLELRRLAEPVCGGAP
jgi:RNA polymerase sigma-70 factor (ECF subfamily)